MVLGIPFNPLSPSWVWEIGKGDAVTEMGLRAEVCSLADPQPFWPQWGLTTCYVQPIAWSCAVLSSFKVRTNSIQTETVVDKEGKLTLTCSITKSFSVSLNDRTWPFENLQTPLVMQILIDFYTLFS